MAINCGTEDHIIILMLYVLADGRKVTPLFFLKKENLAKGKNGSDIIFRCNEKGCMAEELMNSG